MLNITPEKQLLIDYAFAHNPTHAEKLFVLIRFGKITSEAEIDNYNG